MQNVRNRVIFVSYKLANWLLSLPMLVTDLIISQLSLLFMKIQFCPGYEHHIVSGRILLSFCNSLYSM